MREPFPTSGDVGGAASPVGSGSARRLVGFERHYHCHDCGGEHRSWVRLRTCPGCGQTFAAAVIRRIALSA